MALPLADDILSINSVLALIQLEYFQRNIQDVSSTYLVNMPNPNKHLLVADDEFINYITALFQANHYTPVNMPHTHYY